MSDIEWGVPLTGAQMRDLRDAGLPANTTIRVWEDFPTYLRLSECSFSPYVPYFLPANHIAYKVIEAGWLDGRNVALWFGGDKAPDDWDGGAYLCRDGKPYYVAGYSWKHGEFSSTGKADYDRIAYIRKGNVDKSPDGEHQEPEVSKSNPKIDAIAFLDKAEGLLKHRGIDYDSPEGERSMGKTVEAFNAITGRDLTEVEGWHFMALLKMVRQATSKGFHQDSAEDLIAYATLAAEAGASGENP